MEVCARDGLQAVKGILPTDKKIELVLRLVRNAGVKILDVASFVNPKLVPQLDDGAAVLKVLQSELVGANVQLTCLAPNARGMESALKAGATSVSLWVHGSNAFSHKNLGMSCEEHMQQNRVIAGMAEVEHGVSLRAYVSGAIHCPLEGVRIDPQAVGQLAESLAHLSPKVEEIVLADTTGRGGILQVKRQLWQSKVGLIFLSGCICTTPLVMHWEWPRLLSLRTGTFRRLREALLVSAGVRLRGQIRQEMWRARI